MLTDTEPKRQAPNEISLYLSLAWTACSSLDATRRSIEGGRIVGILAEAYKKGTIPNLGVLLGAKALKSSEIVTEEPPTTTAQIDLKSVELGRSNIDITEVREMFNAIYSPEQTASIDDARLYHLFISLANLPDEVLDKLHPKTAQRYTTHYSRVNKLFHGLSANEIADQEGITKQMVHNSRRDLISALRKAYSFEDFVTL